MIEVCEQLRHGDLPAVLLVAIHAEHCSHTVVVETLDFLEFFFSQEPSLTTIQQDAQDEGTV